MKSHAQQVAQRARQRSKGGREAARFYHSKAWRRLRLVILWTHPICQRCSKEPACDVHHVIERERRPDLQLDPDNLEALCKACHSRHTAQTTIKR